jgi:hypothetical protein
MSTQTMEQTQERIDTESCPHCWGLGWIQMTAEDDFGEEETYFTLCRRCSRQYTALEEGAS